MNTLLLFASLPFIYIAWETLFSTVFDGYDPSTQLSGKRVFVGGASTGIGEQMAYEYCRHGSHVALTSRRAPVLQNVKAKCLELGAASAVVIEADLSTHDTCRKALQEALDAPSFEGKLDVLVLNHIIGMWSWFLPDRSATDQSHQDDAPPQLLEAPNSGIWGGYDFVEKIFRVNTLSYIYLSSLALPILEKSVASGGGQIIVLSSGAGKMGLPKVSLYSASKHALHGYFDSLRLELMEKQIPVSITMAVLGNIDTENNRKNTGQDLQFIQRASKYECAEAVVRAGMTRVNELYWPKSQGLHIMVKARPWFQNIMNRILLVVAK